jgi:hypothetical protein
VCKEEFHAVDGNVICRYVETYISPLLNFEWIVATLPHLIQLRHDMDFVALKANAKQLH